MKRILSISSAAAALLAGVSSASAGNLVYTPVNPNFGGSPLNGSWQLQQGQAQNLFNNKGGASGYQAPTAGQLFAQQLTSQIYSSLANQITQAMFGTNAQTSGSYSFGGTNVSFQRVGSEIQITIFDGTTTTQVNVPATTP